MARHKHVHVERWVDERLERLSPPASWEPQLTTNRARLTREMAQTRRRRGVWIVAAATTFLVLLSLTEMPVVRALAQRCEAWLQVTSRAPARTVLPDLSMVDAQGQPVTLSTLRGHVALVTFWTTTCGQCRTEMAWFTEFQNAYRDRNLVVLGVSLDQDGWTEVTPHLAQQPINYRVVVGDRERTQSTIGPAIPTTLLLDRQGRVAVRHIGFCSKAEYRRDLEKLLNE